MDVTDSAAGLGPASPVLALRTQRPDFVRHTQGSHDAMMTPSEDGGLSRYERAAAAHRVAALGRDAALEGHYRGLMMAAGAPPAAARLAAVLAHAERVATAPGRATPADLRALEAAGLSAQAIVALAQIIAFVSYQLRVVAGLKLLAQEPLA